MTALYIVESLKLISLIAVIAGLVIGYGVCMGGI
jgi:hypothetical protein